MKRLTATVFAAAAALTIGSAAHAQFAHEDYYARRADPYYHTRPVIAHRETPRQACERHARWEHMGPRQTWVRCHRLPG